MTLILDSEKSSKHIEHIIRTAEKKLSLMMPVFRISETLFRLLNNAAERNVQITILFSSDELELYERNIISGLPHIEICCCSELNAKCYFNENDMLLTSMDLHNFHEKKSGDMSIALSRINDEIQYEDAKMLYEAFYESSIKLISENVTKTEKSSHAVNAYHGFCIRCAIPISFNTDKPYCRQCMNEVKDESGDNKPENYCHSCAKKIPTSKKNPQCNDCSII